MRTIGFIIRKEFQQLFRDKRLLPLIFLSPVLQIVLLGYAANMDVKDIPLAVCDQDRTVQSRALVDELPRSPGSYVASAVRRRTRRRPSGASSAARHPLRS